MSGTEKTLRTVVTERIRQYPAPDRVIFHLREGIGDSWFQPVKCGGGVTLPSPPTKAAESDVCADCLAGRKTL